MSALRHLLALRALTRPFPQGTQDAQWTYVRALAMLWTAVAPEWALVLSYFLCPICGGDSNVGSDSTPPITVTAHARGHEGVEGYCMSVMTVMTVKYIPYLLNKPFRVYILATWLPPVRTRTQGR